MRSESGKERQLRKRVRTGEEMEDGEDYVIPTITREMPPISASSSTKKGKTKKFHMAPAPIENVTEFDIAKYIRDLPCGLTIGQASSQIPKYRSAMMKSVRRKREANYLDSETGAQTTAAKCKVTINGETLYAILDSGAATSIITKKLMKRLEETIDSPSNLVIVTANGSKVRSLGEISDLPIRI